MRIDLNTGATSGTEKASNSPNASGTARQTSASGSQGDTAEFLLDRIQAQALAPDPVHLIQAGAARLEALRQAVADGSYNVPPAEVAGAIFAERARL